VPKAKVFWNPSLCEEPCSIASGLPPLQSNAAKGGTDNIFNNANI